MIAPNLKVLIQLFVLISDIGTINEISGKAKETENYLDNLEGRFRYFRKKC